MSKDIVIVPCWRRPELLWHCLWNLSTAAMSGEFKVWVCEDDHVDDAPSPDNRLVTSEFPELDVEFKSIEPHSYWGNNYNILQAYAEALQAGAQYIYLVEEDVMVARDFFVWHRAVQAHAEPFCSIAVRHPRTFNSPYAADPPGAVAEDPGRYIVSDHYASLGVCFNRDWLSLVAPYAQNESYLSGLYDYLDLEFPNSRYRGGNGAQDGAIARIMEAHGLRAIYPTRPRAYHAGWYGFNRSMDTQPKGPLEERIAYVGQVLRPNQFTDKLSGDCEVCDLHAAPWNGDLNQWKP